MITHGNKQISEIVYARKASEGGGAVRLTNIIRGAQVVFGGLKPSFAWLDYTTKVAILAAFGQTDGNAVIKATNAYLTALAGTDPTKASALAGFINEDPMLVCSLGLQPQGVTMPIRTMYTDGTAYSITDITPNSTTKTYTAVRRAATGKYKYIFGACGSAGKSSYYFIGANNNSWYNEVRGDNNNFGTATQGVHYVLEFTTLYTKVDGVQYNHGGTGVLGTNTAKMAIGRAINASKGIYDNPWIGSIDYLIVETDGAVARQFLPFYDKKMEKMVWLDVLTGDYTSNFGTWTEKFELPEGTTWTPLNQTP